MPRQLEWRELIPGIIAAAAIVIVVVVTLVFARVGQVHGKKVTLYVVAEEATGILPGTEVWLSGQKQGLVTDVSFRPPATDTMERVLITTEFLEEMLPYVRRDSYAQLKPGGSFIGSLVVAISAGSAGSPPLHDGDTLHILKKGRLDNLASDVGTIEPAFSALVSEVNALNAKLASPVGTIGNARVNGMPRMPDVSARMSRMTARASGNGTIGLAMQLESQGTVGARHGRRGFDSHSGFVEQGRASDGSVETRRWSPKQGACSPSWTACALSLPASSAARPPPTARLRKGLPALACCSRRSSRTSRPIRFATSNF